MSKIHDSLTVKVGDCIDSMQSMESGSVQTCVTSPPYFGLRDYGRKGQIGLEETPEDYVRRLVEVFREVRRVLSEDGTVWLNLGDSYAGSWGAQGRTQGASDCSTISARQIEQHPKKQTRTGSTVGSEYKSKDLMGIPWLVAFALQADGWYLRQDIIWHKPNPMPESVKDRCTKAHEYVFLLSKSARYYYDAEAVKEPNMDPEGSAARYKHDFGGPAKQAVSKFDATRPEGKREFKSTRNRRSVWTINTKSYRGAHFAVFPPDLIEPCILAGSKPGDTVLDPFGGSGTTAGVALKHDRRAAICELNPEYADLIPDRIESIFPNVYHHKLPV